VRHEAPVVRCAVCVLSWHTGGAPRPVVQRIHRNAQREVLITATYRAERDAVRWCCLCRIQARTHLSPNSICALRRLARCSTLTSACFLSHTNRARNTVRPRVLIPRFSSVPSWLASCKPSAESWPTPSRSAIKQPKADAPKNVNRNGLGRKYSRKYFGSRSSFSKERCFGVSSPASRSPSQGHRMAHGPGKGLNLVWHALCAAARGIQKHR
jgi:hypothetical protein